MAAAVREAVAVTTAEQLAGLRTAARETYLTQYSEERNITTLLSAYRRAMEIRGSIRQTGNGEGGHVIASTGNPETEVSP